jgi:hypothetical protein
MQSEGQTYPDARRVMLKHYGPPLPSAFWRYQLHKVTGATKQELVRNLERVRSMQIRAAQDEGESEMQEFELVYPFCGAYPQPERDRLLAEVDGLAKKDMMRKIVARAPEMIRAGVHFAGNAGDSTRIAKRSINGNAVPLTKRPHRENPAEERCFGCGRLSCRPGERCPAHKSACHNCGRMGHYRKVCRKPISGRNVNFCQPPMPEEGS